MLVLANMDQVVHDLVHSPFCVPLAAIIFGFVAMMVCGISSAMSKTLVGRDREQTRRELAAYVAEGSLNPDQAVAMLNAGRSRATSADLDVHA